jgi:hypothetical protein
VRALVAVAAFLGAAAVAPPVTPAAATPTSTVALTAGPRRMAEPAVAVDPRNPRRIVAAADPYLNPVRIQIAISEDGGATWSAPTVVLPPGFAKSYDPTVAFARDGSVLVAGGASSVGRPQCQPGSAVFVAEVGDGRVSYLLVRDARADGAYVDRPAFAYDRARDRLYVDWTESSGPGAECRGAPVASHVALSAATRGAAFDAPRTLPSSGLPAPFGAPIAVARDGTVAVVVGEHEPGRRSRAVVVRSTDGGRTFGAPAVAVEVPAVPASVPAIGGFVSPLPSIAPGPDGETAVAWSHHEGPAATPTIVVDDGAGFAPLSPPPDAGPLELLAQVAYDRSGRLWVLSAQAAAGTVRFVLRSHEAGAWTPATVVAEGRGGSYLELGEALGMAVTPSAVVTAVPVDAAAGSALLVTGTPLPPPSPTTAASATPSTSRDVPDRRAPAPAPGGLAGRWQTVGLVAVAAGSLLLVLQRRRVVRRHR